MKRVTFIFVCLSFAILCQGRIITVDDNGPADFNNIQAAIDDCNNGDKIVVAPGTYYENIHFHGKNITLASTNPADPNIVAVTVIDGNNLDSVVIFAGTETANCLLTGFTITDGHSVELGGGISGNGTQATITHCVITKNTAGIQGGGLEYVNGIISHCIITHNSASIGGGLARCSYKGSCTISNCLITYNYSSYEGGGIARANNASITNCTIVYNNDRGQGLSACLGSITNCIIWGNFLRDCSTPTYSCVQGYASGAGNINADPQFADPNNGDYHLQIGSPCIDAGKNTWPDPMPVIDLDGNFRQIDGDNDSIVVVDMGAYEYGIVETPLISAQPEEFEFIAIQDGPNPAPQTLSIFNMGLDTIDWQIIEDCPWLQAYPTSGSSIGEIDEVTLRVGITGLSTGRQTCDLVVCDSSASNSPVIVSVTLIIHSEDELHVPAEFLTIQAAIDAASDSDVVVAAEGAYCENINFKGKNITLRSTDPNNPDVVAATIIDGQQNGSVVTFNSGEDPDCVLSGFTITNGDALWLWGGGISCQDSSPIIANCIISNNTRGGISCIGYYENIEDHPTITNCIISENSDGPGIAVGCGDFTISNCVITSNIGGGINCGSYKCSSKFTITNCLITQNIALYGGGGIDFDDVGGNARVANCTISGNSAESEGGGGIYCSDSWPIISNCTIVGNRASRGGGIYCRDYSSPTFINCTISGNSAYDGSGIYCYWGSSPTITNCILWTNGESNRPQIYLRDRSNVSVSYTDVQGGWPGEDNIDAAPCFADPNNGDYHLKSQAGRWDPVNEFWVKDEVTSLCIDAGDPASSIGLEPFPNGGIINMGAYGGTSEASKSYFGKPVCETIVAGDINGDCKVNFKDFAIMAFHWLEER